MGAILDIVLSIAVRGAIALAVLNVTIALQTKLSEKTAQANEITLVNTVSGILVQDFEKAGYNMAGPPYLTVAKTDTIEICYQNAPPPAYPATTPTRVKFYASDSLQMLTTTNPNDRILYKSVNGGAAIVVTKGVVKLKFQYYDAFGATTANINNVRSFSVDLIMARGEMINGIYVASEWYKRFFPPGMR